MHDDLDITFGPVRHFGWHRCYLLHIFAPQALCSINFYAHVTSTCIVESTFHNPHKESLIPRPPRKCGYLQAARVNPPRAGL